MTDGPTLSTLADRDLPLSDLTAALAQLESSTASSGTTRFGISANVTLDLLETFLRRQAVLAGSRASVSMGSLNDHLGNARHFAGEGVDALIVLDLLDAFTPAFEATLEHQGPDRIAAQIDRYRNQLGLTLAAADGITDVFVAGFHRLSPPRQDGADAIDEAVEAFNAVLRAESAGHRNVHILSTDAICADVGWGHAVQMRSYQRFRAPYTPPFLDRLAAAIYDSTRAFGAYYYKALVLDADGTLWGGIVGEDGPAGVELDPFTYPGSMYWRMQHAFLSLQRRGLILCLCSKNEASDVDQILSTHPSMVLRGEDFVAKRVNWETKVDNLESLAKELDIGLDSMIFIDDSPFECDAVRARLPAVRTLQVPTELSRYPTLVDEIDRLVPRPTGLDGETKTRQYQAKALAEAARATYGSEAEYLASLETRVEIRSNDRASVARIAELTQKSNQFNLTTRRHSPAQIETLMDSSDSDVLSIHVSDRFGDSGLVGVLITKDEDDDTLRIDSFLMSCRVLGRGVELAPWTILGQRAAVAGRHVLLADYLPTPKNAQVRDFWDRVGLTFVGEDTSGARSYRTDLLTSQLTPIPSHIEVWNAH